MKGRYVVSNPGVRKRLHEIIDRIPDEPRYQVTIEPYQKARSLEQNNRYWAMLRQIAQEMPQDMDGEYHRPEVWHEYFKKEFIGCDVLQIDGEAHLLPKDSKTLGVMDFMEFMGQVELWAIEHNIFFGEAA